MSTAIQFGAHKEAYVPPAFEPEIRNRILAGTRVAAIAAEFGADETRLRNYVYKRIKGWRAQGAAPATVTANAKPSARGITVYRPFVGKSGNMVMKPIRLAYVTMHARALEESRRHG
ncbi:hypothetical protein IB238_05495 [Rhizobium sp. ARZ01]|uniref:hypothetical protein n=1 Tax=Rhizobium sp. ARZ01 TaxID=2769313 RepID=UPI00177CFD7F|nr:hypothetical protein [Rhizobium sp. ARZ01]MBD9372083.1 hypothetical protein [Rhizobium sp. ARZ01]